MGKARKIQVTNNSDKPIRIIGFLPILSDNDPVKGENIA